MAGDQHRIARALHHRRAPTALDGQAMGRKTGNANVFRPGDRVTVSGYASGVYTVSVVEGDKVWIADPKNPSRAIPIAFPFQDVDMA